MRILSLRSYAEFRGILAGEPGEYLAGRSELRTSDGDWVMNVSDPGNSQGIYRNSVGGAVVPPIQAKEWDSHTLGCLLPAIEKLIINCHFVTQSSKN